MDQLQQNVRFLDTLVSGSKPSTAYCYDLLANARRRADLEQKFDDAAARLYRAVELLAQVELKEIYGIETSDVKDEVIPETLKREYLLKYKDNRDGRIRMPLFASYQLLKELGNRRGERFFEVYESEIRPVLSLRNSSILAHGLNSIDEKTFRSLWGTLVRFSEIREEEIPVFPELKP